ncbi:hypothetical protein KIN20_001090 [Parelaphostrongylus tenuis]|uniref:Uncharacterized protein n=1 Tax=Parelaphostrongylus tenuis TaxID=148309 RepID=A0AAD5QG13_PARTN|nr:hypothetical protein KIN20_001090 [Parelaphostrongylus tenuis]
MDEKNYEVESTTMYAPLRRPPTYWAGVLVKRINQFHLQLLIFYRSRHGTRTCRHAEIRPASLTTVAHQRDEWNMCWDEHSHTSLWTLDSLVYGPMTKAISE